MPFIEIKGEKYDLTCHPYEPCLYIKGARENITAVHNSFDPSSVLELIRDGKKFTSITGREYGAKDFCRMVESAAETVDIQIDDAERLAFGERIINKKSEPQEKKRTAANAAQTPRFGKGNIIEDDPALAVLGEYPDSVIDFCLVKNDRIDVGYNAHRRALASACLKLFIGEDGMVEWHYDAGKADGKQICADELFAPVEKDGKMNYRKAFLCPPHTNTYTDADFDKINAALFPNGTDGLEAYEWTTDWSEYFDEGREWWGTLCLTVYDKTLDRFAVIMASATD